MGKPTGFLEIPRKSRDYKPVEERIKHYQEFSIPHTDEELSDQGARCMDCGTPFCHTGCPVNNIIPEWNDLVYRKKWQEALDVLHSTNNFPEFTGRVCPAPCETSCTLYLEDIPVTIRDIELSIVEKGWEMGWIKPQVAKKKTGKKVAIIGSGPAGLACAQQLARAGHQVHVYEKQDRIGGLMRYGIPDFKFEKHFIDRRLTQMRAEGVEFFTHRHVGVDIRAEELLADYDAVVLAMGSEEPRDLAVPGRDLDGVHFAMDFLRQNNKRVAGDAIPESEVITAEGKHVVVIGGGDTGSDCIGTSVRQGAKSVTQLEIMPQPPENEDKLLIWPDYPHKLRVSTSQKEGSKTEYCIATKELSGMNGKVSILKGVKVEWSQDENDHMQMQEVDGGEVEFAADLVLLAMGFIHPVKEGLIEQLGIELDERGNAKASEDDYQTSISKVFASGDTRRGQSLIVWAIREGRQTAHEVDKFLMGESNLPR